MLQKIIIEDYSTSGGFRIRNLPLTFQIFGREIGSAPVVLVTHALTGNSDVGGEKGWWSSLVGNKKTIDTDRFSVICFDIPGNGYNGFLFKEYEKVKISDVANWFLYGLEVLGITSVFAGIGGSLGGYVLWEMAFQNPKLFENLIPVASDWKATNWLVAQCRIQKQILENSINPVYDARIHAMTLYRSPKSLKEKFERKSSDNITGVENWLFHHGNKLKERFHLQAYRLMNHLLMSHNFEMNEKHFLLKASRIEGNIFLIGIDSDGFFLNEEIQNTYSLLKRMKQNVFYQQIESIHGHDAFLIEYRQLDKMLSPIFRKNRIKIKNKNYEFTFVELNLR